MAAEKNMEFFMNFSVDVKILDPRLQDPDFLPTYATPSSAGLDLRAMLPFPDDELILLPGASVLVPTGLSVHIKDPGFVGLILPRSGLGHKKGVVLGNGTGVIDADYQGPLMMSLWNRSQNEVIIASGERVAQFLVVPVAHVSWNIVDDFDDVSARAEGGFGSTGSS